MKRLMWGLIAVLMLAASADLVAASKSNVETPEGLAEKFISNINAKDLDSQWELIHPHCVKELSSLQREFVDATLAKGLQYTIPEERSIRIVPYDTEKSLPFESIAVWPELPTHRFEVEFITAEHRTIGIARYIVKKDNEWFIVVPLIHADCLSQRKEMKTAMDVVGATWYEAPNEAKIDDDK